MTKDTREALVRDYKAGTISKNDETKLVENLIARSEFLDGAEERIMTLIKTIFDEE